MPYSTFGTLRGLETELNTPMPNADCNKNLAAQTGKDSHGPAHDIQIRQDSTESLLCTLLLWTAELRNEL